jgi:hypothetical protein
MAVTPYGPTVPHELLAVRASILPDRGGGRPPPATRWRGEILVPTATISELQRYFLLSSCDVFKVSRLGGYNCKSLGWACSGASSALAGRRSIPQDGTILLDCRHVVAPDLR